MYKDITTKINNSKVKMLFTDGKFHKKFNMHNYVVKTELFQYLVKLAICHAKS
jgi:hypothetical protein